jgi:hypothetical protein
MHERKPATEVVVLANRTVSQGKTFAIDARRAKHKIVFTLHGYC